jgi:predicted acyl esterase
MKYWLTGLSGEVQFKTPPFDKETEITGHPVLRVTTSVTSLEGSEPSEMDVFVTLRHIGVDGEESQYGSS